MGLKPSRRHILTKNKTNKNLNYTTWGACSSLLSNEIQSSLSVRGMATTGIKAWIEDRKTSSKALHKHVSLPP